MEAALVIQMTLIMRFWLLGMVQRTVKITGLWRIPGEHRGGKMGISSLEGTLIWNMESVQLTTWLHIQPRSLLLHPQLVLLHRPHRQHPRRRLLFLLRRPNVETYPIVQLMRHVVACLSTLIFASSMVAVSTRMLSAAPEQSIAAPVITPFVTLKIYSVSK